MRGSSRHGLIAVRATAAGGPLFAKCQSCGFRVAKITGSCGSTGTSIAFQHTPRGMYFIQKDFLEERARAQGDLLEKNLKNFLANF